MIRYVAETTRMKGPDHPAVGPDDPTISREKQGRESDDPVLGRMIQLPPEIRA
jgi:hypothetical protein